jgi:4-amino-4-deoxy-L-arabinose transferase-like glycosyltransferase
MTAEASIAKPGAHDGEAAPAGKADAWSKAELSRLVGLLLVGLVVRLVILWRFAGIGVAIVDEQHYDQLAVSIAERGEFAFAPGQLTSIRPPLYPAVVAGVYRVAGSQNYQAVRLLQIAMSLVTTGLVYVLARRLYDERVALVAAAIHCFYPSLLGAGALVLTEIQFTLLVCGFLVLFERYLSTSSRGALAGAGVVLGLAALTRSALWLFPPVAVMFILVVGTDRTWLGRIASSAALVLAFVVVLAPWTIRNTRLQQTFTTVDVMGGRNVMMGNYEHTPWHRPWAAIDMDGEKAWHRVLSEHHGGFSGKTQGQIDKLAMKYALGYIAAHPVETLQLSTAKFFHFWQLERELVAGAKQGFWGPISTPALLLMAAVILGAYIATIVLGIFGFALVPPQNWRMHLFLLLLTAYVTALHCVAFGHSRYHLPLMPILMIYAAALLVNWRKVSSSWRSWRFAAAAALCLALAVSWGLDLLAEAGRF